MKRRWMVAAATALGAGTMAVAVPAIGKDYDGNRDRGRHGEQRGGRRDDDRGGHRDGDRDGRREIVTMRGNVERVLVDPYGKVDGLLLSGNTVLRFPAIDPARLGGVIARGDGVIAQGRVRGNELRTRVVENLATHRSLSVVEAPWYRMKTPDIVRDRGLQAMRVRGTIVRTIAGKRGEVRQLVFGDGTVARLDHEDARTAGVLRPGIAVMVTGRGTATPAGRGLFVDTIARVAG